MNVEAIYLNHQSELQFHLARIVNCPDIAADIAQESFIIFFREAQKQTIDHPRGFLFRVAKNLAYDYIKHQKVTENYEQAKEQSQPLHSEFPSAEKLVSVDERLATVTRILDELPLRTREIFIMNRIYGMTYAETAKQLNISDSSVEKHMAKALLHCRKQFKNHRLDQHDC
ncbi:RNA polymerase sigma factor [Candidatus Methylobacter oryzae]|uniref:Sigma-70 family RNA polymerase sigma factor n=1 Tax=Candidatus Methylobacter oryzae TaxID=2497749 RepID=A0ABY3C962_9GAMM|nr:sigma-70 family RNA polymerase sigma factor [Candidatus Methylobacter oryzae]TRW90624.1 sigma-70 family RNA polymerase sigma factor [Candidatus Methylobacter oryzae]